MAGPVDLLRYGLVIAMFLLFINEAYFMEGNFLIPTTSSYFMLPEVKVNADAWYSRVVTPGEMEATGWINANTNESDKFVADIFGAELIMGMTTRVSTIGGDWANAPDPIKYMSDTNTIYTTNDAGVAHRLAREENCSYVFLPERQTFSGYEWVYGDHQKFEDEEYFKLVYENSDVKIYKVLA